MKTKIMTLLVCMFLYVAVLASCSIPIAPTTPPDDVIPEYEGMTISGDKTLVAEPVFGDGNNGNSGNTNNNGNTGDHENNGHHGRPGFSYEKDDEKTPDIEDVVTLEVYGDEETKYFVSPGETFIVEVHLSNPSQFEIQSFTLNGQKYANYMFEENSTMELLLLKVQAPEEPGYMELTIDAIKYIDGTEIKDVKMTGEKTIKAGITYAKTPMAEISNLDIDTTGLTLTATITDPQNVIGDAPITFYLSDGETVLFEQALQVGANTIAIDNLLTDKVYAYGIGTSYDMVDGRGVQTDWLHKSEVYTDMTFVVTDAVIGQDSIDLVIDKVGENGTLTSIKLFDGENGDELQSLADLEVRRFEGLLSNHVYTITLGFTYESSEQQQQGSCTIVFTTAEKTVPTITFENVSSNQTMLSFDCITTDADKLLTIVSIELFDSNTLVGTAEKGEHIVFDSLTADTLYTVKITYTYDLSNGDGVQTVVAELKYPTLADSISIEEIFLLNDNVVKLGGEINLRIFFTNSSRIQMTAIYVNGQKVDVVGGDRITSAIVKFVPEQSGLVDFEVDRVDYEAFGVSVQQNIDSNISVSYPVYRDITPVFTPISGTPYEYTGLGLYMEYDNPDGYQVYKVNGEMDFIRLSDNSFYIPDDSISSIEYGYDNYGTTIQRLFCSANSTVSFGEYKKIYTVEDFLGMTDGYYILMNDLDMRKTSLSQPIELTGVLDGNGHIIRGLSYIIDTASQNDMSTFRGGHFYDVTFTELYVSANNAGSSTSVSIWPLDATLINCHISGDVTGVYTDFSSLVQQGGSCHVNITMNGNTTTQTYTSAVPVAKDQKFVITKNYVAYAYSGTDCILLNYFGEDTHVVLDEEPYQIKMISEGAFRDNTIIESIVIPGTVTIIDDFMFSGCTNLATVTFDKNIQLLTVGNSAFANCLRLDSITIPDGVTSIGENAFSGCTSLISVFVPSSVTSILAQAFDNEKNLIIYTDATSKPDGWIDLENYVVWWNCNSIPVSHAISATVDKENKTITYTCQTCDKVNYSIPYLALDDFDSGTYDGNTGSLINSGFVPEYSNGTAAFVGPFEAPLSNSLGYVLQASNEKATLTDPHTIYLGFDMIMPEGGFPESGVSLAIKTNNNWISDRPLLFKNSTVFFNTNVPIMQMKPGERHNFIVKLVMSKADEQAKITFTVFVDGQQSGEYSLTGSESWYSEEGWNNSGSYFRLCINHNSLNVNDTTGMILDNLMVGEMPPVPKEDSVSP